LEIRSFLIRFLIDWAQSSINNGQVEVSFGLYHLLAEKQREVFGDKHPAYLSTCRDFVRVLQHCQDHRMPTNELFQVSESYEDILGPGLFGIAEIERFGRGFMFGHS